MTKKVEIEIDEDLLQEVIRRFHLHDTREAVNLALRTLLHDGEAPEPDDEYDEFSDPSAWEPRRSGEGG